MIPSPQQIIVVGGGAAGFFAAINGAIAFPQAQFTILEAGRDFLTKVRISGGGRCNVTHHCFDPAQLVQSYPRGGKALRGAFSRFQPRDMIAWFADRQVSLKTEADGRMFPVSDDSQTIIDCFLDTAQAYGVQLRARCPVSEVQKSDSGFQVFLKNGQLLTGDRLLLATGSHPTGYQIATHLGHHIEPPVPSLFTFNLRDPRLAGLAGISLETVQLSLGQGKNRRQQEGPLLITHWGLSGPSVLKLSAWAARELHAQRYQMPLQINWLPSETVESCHQLLQTTKQTQGRKSIFNFFPVNLPKRLWQSFLLYLNIHRESHWADLNKTHLQRLSQELTQGHYQIQGKGVFKEEFVTCGGVKLKEVNFKTMESKLCPGLYFAGEILDIDGITGGFNFQSAWTTGWLASQAIALSITFFKNSVGT
ncbi:MAG: NAD(P)/FAD-dependent oxidoreductase [Microcystaceae cyanobacterium]